ncbi:MAG: hypothetical protein IIA61_11730 [Candidatus Marinimicrobia bacterium]|nr:hypothetical protein [Candidatus Neomarinimicrobiota bacterium]MCH8012599.1 hypothetical protein [Candidatus Neomarinimicrobiota bacterium]
MSESHRVSAESGSINLPAFEVGFASICVAIVAGSIGGNIGTLLTDVFPFWGLLIFILGLGFIIPWVVCKYLFKTAHAWYGSSTLKHRLYDGVGMISAVVAFYI